MEKTYIIDKSRDVNKVLDVEVVSCVLYCEEVETGKKIKIVMDKERFKEWRERFKQDG